MTAADQARTGAADYPTGSYAVVAADPVAHAELPFTTPEVLAEMRRVKRSHRLKVFFGILVVIVLALAAVVVVFGVPGPLRAFAADDANAPAQGDVPITCVAEAPCGSPSAYSA